MKLNIDNNVLKILLHVFSWAGIVSLALSTAPFDIWVLPIELHIKIFGHFLFIISFYYINTLVYIPKLLFRKKVLLYIVTVLVSLFVVYAINVWLSSYLELEGKLLPYLKEGSHFREFSGERRHVLGEKATFITSLMTFVYGVIISAVGRAIRQDKDKEEVEKEKLIAELAFLKNQINPHFFFNTLNNIYSFVGSNPDKARKTIHQLSKMMRYMLYETDKQTISISQEIEFLQDYIKLMRLRLPEEVKVEFEQDKLDASIEVPPLVFIPFIENAFKHGISYEQDSTIQISITSSNLGIHLKVLNKVHKKPETGEVGGIGLVNIRKRLELLYPQKDYKLDIKQTPSLFSVNLILPLDDTMYSHR